ncbi:hypothetical protein [Deefgea rivuli]|uniref:hypothetical protein n=1 Tax=Deefgea rivuli TaxID=400948 RepID=UPI00068595A7|nr:hypothetical protein [Deefgea rivuli]
MNSLTAFGAGPSSGLRTNDPSLAQSLRKMSDLAASTGKALAKGSELMQQRVDHLGAATTQMASDFINQFAQQLFGDQAKGMTIEFDEMSLSAESSFTALQQTSQSAQGSSQASAFRLSDASHFTGKGTLTTADGQRFDIEIEIRYESVIEGASIARQSNTSNTPKAIPSGAANVIDVADLLAAPSQAETTAAAEKSRTADRAEKNDRNAFKQDFAGTAMDLLQRLTSEPAFKPFSLFSTDSDGKNALQLLGEMSLQLLNLPGGPRHVDLSPDYDPSKKALDEKA